MTVAPSRRSAAAVGESGRRVIARTSWPLATRRGTIPPKRPVAPVTRILRPIAPPWFRYTLQGYCTGGAHPGRRRDRLRRECEDQAASSRADRTAKRTMVVLGLAGDTMLGRLVGERLATDGPHALLAPEVIALAREADLFVLNLECCISDGGDPWPAPGKRFFFRAPPAAVDVLTLLGVDCVTLANNHALDFGPRALLDTFTRLERAGIAWVGAGPNRTSARAPVSIDASGFRLTVVAVTDHPADFAAEDERPGVAWADLRRQVPGWLTAAVSQAAEDMAAPATTAGAVLLTPHWGPNMVADPVPHVRRAASTFRDVGATLVAGHSAHVFHGVEDSVLYDLGDFLDDYATSALRNDLGLFFLIELDDLGPRRLEAIPLALDFCRTRIATGDDATWVADRFRRACKAFGTTVQVEQDRVVISWR